MSTSAPALLTGADYPADYIELTFTADEQTLADDAVANLQTTWDGWEPNDGDMEVVLIETLAPYAVAAIEQASQVPPTAFIALGTKLYGIAYGEGVNATTTVTLTFQDAAGNYDVPSGSEFELSGYAFQTVDDVTSAVGSATLSDVAVIAGDVGIAYNNLTDADWSAVTLPVWVVDLSTEAPTAGGVDAQDDYDYLNMLSRELQLRGRMLVTLPDFEIAAVNTEGIGRAYASTTAARAVTVTLMDPNGLPVSSTVKAELLATYQAATLVNVTFTLADATYTTIGVAYEVVALPGFDPTALQTSINQTLSSFLSPLGWGTVSMGQPGSGQGSTSWLSDNTVRLNKLISIIGTSPGVGYVVANTVVISGVYAAHLSSTLSTSAATTSLPVTGLANTVPSGATITITDPTGAHTQTWHATAQVAPGATTIPVTSQTANFAYTSAATLSGPVVGDFVMPGTVALPTPGTMVGTIDMPVLA